MATTTANISLSSDISDSTISVGNSSTLYTAGSTTGVDTMTSVTDVEKDIVEIRGFRDMYERFVREDSCDFKMHDFILLAILEIQLGNYDIAIQRLMEFKTMMFGGTRPSVMPPLNDKIYRTGGKGEFNKRN